MTREDRRAAASVFTILFAQILLICIWIIGGLSDGFHPERRPAIFLLCLLVPLVCAGLVTYHFARRRLPHPLIEDSTSEGDRKSWVTLTPLLTAVDYCVLIPIFLMAYLLTRDLFLAVLNRLFGVPESRVPLTVAVLLPCLLAASLTVSHIRRRVRRRHDHLLRERNRKRERRIAQQARRDAALARMDCPKCGYNITGLPQRRCPECGETWTRIEEEAAPETRPERRA